MTYRYAVTEIFPTIQGEGHHAGIAAVFVRFAGCNMWSGVPHRRDSDARRNQAECPRWCDTDFNPRLKLTAEEICHDIRRLGPVPLIVLTGGEPLLQVDEKLMQAIGGLPAQIAVETNGTVKPKFTSRRYVWITCSPKQARERTVLERADELKLVYPAHDPEQWATFPAGHRFLQPQADGPDRNLENEAATVAYIQKNPLWRLSLQTHKILGIS